MDWLIWIYVVIFFFGIYFLFLFVILYQRHKKQLFDFPIPTEFPEISLIVPAYNEEKTISGTIEALLNLEYPEGKKEIIIVNDGSKDNTLGVVKGFMKNHKEIKLLDKKNSGKADSLNKAINIARGKLIAVSDADSYPEKDCLYKMVGYFEQDEKVAAVTSKVWAKNNRNFMEKFQEVDYTVIAWSRKILDFIGCVYVTNGPLSIYRKKVVQKVGGFDPQNITEDIELTWNLLSHGYKTKMSYSAVVYTLVPDNFKIWNKQRIRWNLGGFQTLNKYRSFFLRGENLFGYFVITYVGLSFVLALIGMFLLLRYFYLKFSPIFYTLPYLFKNYNPFMFFEFNFNLTLLSILGLMFLVLSVLYHKFAFRKSQLLKKGIVTILIYSFIYRPLYIVPLVMSLYKLIKGDIRWYTK